ncbi:hypothetical protein CRG98_039287 [Punica granatum]|uniref:Uncharacterized protein n=1 Tax=Punica granatum TaxID=22663 RepID=A0A2I0I8N0_PUNGR|nr:hypothetical protein CRG98_039287 [Punica granatum]
MDTTEPRGKKGKIGSRLREFGDRCDSGPTPENRENSLDSGRFDLGEVQTRHRVAQAAPRAISRTLSCRRRGVQRRESPPPASRRRCAPIPATIRLTGHGPFLFLCRLGPFRPKALQPGPASLPGGFSFGPADRSDPIRPVRPAAFVYYRNAPKLLG